MVGTCLHYNSTRVCTAYLRLMNCVHVETYAMVAPLAPGFKKNQPDDKSI